MLRVSGVTHGSSGSDPEAIGGRILHSADMTSHPTTNTTSDATGVPVRTHVSGGPGVIFQHSEAGVPVRLSAAAGGLEPNHAEAVR